VNGLQNNSFSDPSNLGKSTDFVMASGASAPGSSAGGSGSGNKSAADTLSYIEHYDFQVSNLS
jgi:hypothetical protein